MQSAMRLTGSLGGLSADVCSSGLLAVAVPRAASIAAAVGLQPRFAPSATEPLAVITGGRPSTFQLMVRVVVLLLPRSEERRVGSDCGCREPPQPHPEMSKALHEVC